MITRWYKVWQVDVIKDDKTADLDE